MIFTLLVLLCTGFIFYNSSQDAVISGNRSLRIVEILQKTIPWITDYIVRKLAHMLEFAGEGFLVFGMCFAYLKSKRDKGFIYLLSSFCGLLIAMTDETLQMFSLGRSCEVKDVWIDFLGVTLGCLFALLIRHKRKKKAKKTKTLGKAKNNQMGVSKNKA